MNTRQLPFPAMLPLTDQGSAASLLLDKLTQIPFAHFELCIKQLLVALGYERPQSLGRRYFRGGAKTGGADIQTFLATDRIAVPVLVVLKQFKRDVQLRYVDELRGSLARRRVTHGLIVTTSRFPKRAEEAARSGDSRIDLIDGETLAGLLLTYGIGVKTIQTTSIAVDDDYFETLGEAEEGSV